MSIRFPRRLLRHLWLAPLLALHVWLAVGRSERVGLTADEGIHIAGGFYYQKAGDYRFHPENGQLPQRLLALPWLAADLEPEPADSFSRTHAAIWTLSDALFAQAGERSHSLLARSRLITAMVGAGVLIVVYVWALSLFGPLGAGISVFFAAFCPNLLAHAGLATSDVWGLLGALLATLTFWRLCHRITPARVAAAGLAAGFFALCKFSCVLFAPVALALVGARLLRRADLPVRFGAWRVRLRGRRRAPALLAAGAIAAVLAVGMVWAAYGFRYAAAPAGSGDFLQSWDTILVREPRLAGHEQLGAALEDHTITLRQNTVARAVDWMRGKHLLPEAWLYGLAYVNLNSQSRLSYLNGEYSLTGWRSYFPLAFIWKTPVGGLLALALAVLAWAGSTRRARLLHRAAGPLILGGVVLGFAVFSRINIGIRHLLPTLIVLWLCVGACAAARPGRTRIALLAALALAGVAHAAATLCSAPHTLTFFNTLAGPAPDRRLVDSNLDWGQGLPELRHWLDRNPEKRPAYLSYFGADLPSRHGIELPRFADLASDAPVRALPANLEPGWYCFGPTQFRRAYTRTRGPWTLARESLYRSLLAEVIALGRSRAENPDLSVSAEQIDRLRAFDDLRLARLTLYLDGRAPEHRLPGGVMVFRLTTEDLNFAFYAPLDELAEAAIRRLAPPAADAAPSR